MNYVEIKISHMHNASSGRWDWHRSVVHLLFVACLECLGGIRVCIISFFRRIEKRIELGFNLYMARKSKSVHLLVDNVVDFFQSV